jgi:hypothetical protein
LRAVLKWKKHLRRCLNRCRHCRIFFFTHPRNAGRKDLGCPFGCRKFHRRIGSDKRSGEYYRTPAGKDKKKAQNDKRCKNGPVANSRKEPEEKNTEVESTTPLFEAGVVDHVRMVTSLIEDHEVSLEEVKRTETQVENGKDVPKPEPRKETEDPVKEPEKSREEPGESMKQPEGKSAGAEPDDLKFDAGMVDYVRMVTSLIEGRKVSREEVLEMLKRTMRQHSIGQEKRIDYILRTLKEKPP